MKRIALTTIILIAGMMPAQAHTDLELEEWLADWSQRAHRSGMTLELATEWADMHQRHLPPPPPPKASRSSSSAGSSSSSRPATNRGMGINVEQWRGMVAAHFAPADIDRALCIMGYESGGNPNAKNPRSSARGLMQILASIWAPHYGITAEALYDPNTNLAIAADIKANQGWTAWAPYNRGLCQ